MKKLFTNLFLLTFSLCYSQNWAPINSIEKFNYQIDTASYISNTLWIDSVKIIGSDSVFYLNKIVLDCFDCPWTFDPLIEFKIANQGQFLQERIIKKEPDVYRFEGKRTFTLKTHFALNESWTFDSTGNVVATVVDIFEDEIFGETDSLKTIQLSNGDTIWLSKDHGIIKFVEGTHCYELKGIEGRYLGEILPDFWGFYNFDIGDVFQYEHTDGTFEGTLWQWNTVKKYEILAKQTDTSKIIYEVYQVSNRSYTTNNGTFPVSSSQGVETIEFELISAPYYIGQFNRALVKYDQYELCGDDIRHYMGVYRDPTDNRVVKKTGNPFPYYPDMNTSYQFINFDEQSDTLVLETCAANFYYEFKEGIGLIHSRLSDFESWESAELVGYIKGTDTVGVISADADILMNANEVFADETQIEIYPNPIDDGTLNLKVQSNNNLQVDIFNLEGRLIYHLPLQSFGSLAIDLNKQPSGIYIVRLGNQNFIKIYKAVKY